MTLNTRHIPLSLIYVAIMSWIYLNEIVPYWAYMGFKGTFTIASLAVSLAITVLMSVLIPKARDTRMAILTCVHYLFFLPTVIYLSYSDALSEHYLSLFILWASITFLSSIKIKPPVFATLKPKIILFLAFGSTIFALLIQAAYGGLQSFNLDIERVYEFRREAASNLPMIFGYVYSNVASVLLPLALVLSFKFRAYALVGLALVCSVILFGMTHHKSVLFGPPAVALLYVFFSRIKSPNMIGIAFMAIPAICAAELFYIRFFTDYAAAGYLNSLIARRVIFVPPMLDSLYVDFFSINAQYYWSTSRIGSWAMSNPHGITAPFLIGETYFLDSDMSANTGVIGSGYANAGLVGIAFYSAACGLLLALLNAYGRRVGHPLAAAVSLLTVFNVLTSTDLLTAFLTHGLLLLLVMLALFPLQTVRRVGPVE